MSPELGHGALNSFRPGPSCLTLLDLKCFQICNGYASGRQKPEQSYSNGQEMTRKTEDRNQSRRTSEVRGRRTAERRIQRRQNQKTGRMGNQPASPSATPCQGDHRSEVGARHRRVNLRSHPPSPRLRRTGRSEPQSRGSLWRRQSARLRTPSERRVNHVSFCDNTS
jgi:hypothetical protein